MMKTRSTMNHTSTLHRRQLHGRPKILSSEFYCSNENGCQSQRLSRRISDRDRPLTAQFASAPVHLRDVMNADASGKLATPINDSQIGNERSKPLVIFTCSPKSDAPPIQGPLVVLSISVFMMYFCIIREENDIDEGLYNLNPIVPGATKGR